jgi:hypothetical protein
MGRKKEERFLDCANRRVRTKRTRKKKRRLASLGMTIRGHRGLKKLKEEIVGRVTGRGQTGMRGGDTEHCKEERDGGNRGE